MSREKQIESTDWLTRGISKEQLKREKQEAIMSADLELCHTEFATGVGEIYTDYDTTAQKLIAKGWSKQSEGEWISVKDRLPEKDGRYLVWVVTPNRGCVEGVQMRWFRNCDIYYNYMWKNHYTHWMPLPEPPKMKGGAE